MRPDRVRVLIVEDHPIFLKGLTSLLGLEPRIEVVAEATSRHAAVEAAEATLPDLILMDLSLGDESGLDAIKDILYRRPETRILVLSMHEEEVYRRRSLTGGALGFCHKREPLPVLLDAIWTVAEGRIWTKSAEPQEEAAGGGVPDNLTDRELDVFLLMGTGSGTAEIARALHVSVKTVDSHKANLRDKLGCASAADLRKAAVSWASRERRL